MPGVVGVASVVGNLSRTSSRVRAAGGRAVRAVMEERVTRMKARTPVDTGALRGSGHATGPDFSGETIEARAIFGGPAAGYAPPVHENLRAVHPVGQAKFVESVMLESEREFMPDVAARMRTELA